MRRGGGEWGREGVSGFFVESLLPHNTEKLFRGTLLSFRIFLVSKFSKIRGEGAPLTFICQKFSSHSTKFFRRRILLCFRYFPLSKILMDERRGREVASQ